MSDVLTFLLILGFVFIGFKLLGVIFKAGIFIVSLPLMIILGVLLTVLIVALFPLAMITGVVAVLLAPLGILAPLLPFILIGLGIYMLAR